MVSNSEDITIYQIEIAPKAKQDLRKIHAFIKESSEFKYIADEQLSFIKTSISKLSVFPKGYPRYSENCPYRMCHAKKYCLIFNVDTGKRIVTVLRIFHARQNINKELS